MGFNLLVVNSLTAPYNIFMPRGVYRRTKKHRDAARLNALKADPRKISETLKRKGIKPPTRKGTIRSSEARLKSSATMRKLWASGLMVGNRGKKLNISSEGLARKLAATQTMRRSLAKKGRLTDIEKLIDLHLHKNNIVHEHEYAVGNKCMDFYLPNLSIFIEADSDYWHQDKEKDIQKDLYVNKLMPNVKIVRCNEKSIKDGSWVTLIPWGSKRGV